MPRQLASAHRAHLLAASIVFPYAKSAGGIARLRRQADGVMPHHRNLGFHQSRD